VLETDVEMLLEEDVALTGEPLEVAELELEGGAVPVGPAEEVELTDVGTGTDDVPRGPLVLVLEELPVWVGPADDVEFPTGEVEYE